MHTILITLHNCNKITTENNNITKKFTNTSDKKYISFSFCSKCFMYYTIETNRTLNPVCKCFNINQIYMEIFTFSQSSKLMHMQFIHALDFQDLIAAFFKGVSIF